MNATLDGDIDYTKYELRELLEIRKHIKKAEFPKNHANLVAAIEAHPNATVTVEQDDSAESSIWASLDGEHRFASPGAKDTTVYLAIFFVVFFPVAFLFEFMFALMGWSVGTIFRVIYFAISAAVVGAVFGATKKRLMTVTEFSGFASATIGTHIALTAILTFLLAAGTEGSLGFACGSACGLFALAVVALLEIGLLFLCLRFIMRWAMVATARIAE